LKGERKLLVNQKRIIYVFIDSGGRRRVKKKILKSKHQLVVFTRKRVNRDRSVEEGSGRGGREEVQSSQKGGGEGGLARTLKGFLI